MRKKTIIDLEAELSLLADADARAAKYLMSVDDRPAFPSPQSIRGLDVLTGALPQAPSDPEQTLALLDEFGGPGTVASNGPNYFGFVIGASLPAAAAAERLAAAWDQCASSYVNSPAMATIEKAAGAWLLDILDLPKQSGVGFGTSATACGLSCLAIARTGLLEGLEWDLSAKGLAGAPEICVVVPASVHVTVKKTLRLLGFGMDRIVYAPVDEYGRVLPDQLPPMNDHTILCLQAGEVNTGEFDPFTDIIPKAKAAGAWVHVDGAFGLWARASRNYNHLTCGIELADSWTTDGHKWLNTPYDSAVSICRDKTLMAKTLNADAVYAQSEEDAQKNLTLEFSRRARGLGFWAALRSLGRDGIEELVDRYCSLATRLAAGCAEIGIPVSNRVVLNQVLCAFDDEEKTKRFVSAVQASGKVWFGPTVWQGKAAFRLSVSSWKTTEDHIDRLIEELARHL